VAILQQIKAQGEPAAILWVARCLFESSDKITTTASQTIHRLLSLVSPDQLIHLCDVIGCSWSGYVSDDWDKLKPNGIYNILGDHESRAAVLGLLSFHRNGYVRHEAVRLLSQVETGDELPFLLIRQNDWVGVISEDAQSAVSKRLVPDYLPHFVRCLPLVVHLLSFTRRKLSAVVCKVVQMMVRPEHDALLAEVVKTSSLAVRRQVVRVALEIDGEHQARVILHGISSPDAIIRFTCAKAVGRIFSGSELHRATKVLQQDPFMPVRREGFRIEAEHNPGTASNIWQRALLDPNASIRELARFWLGKIGAFEAAGFYRKVISANGISLATANGLAECGDESDLAAIRSFLAHPQTKFRVAGVQGIARIAKERAFDDLVRALQDESPSVVREAKKQLAPYMSEAHGEVLFAVAKEAPGGPAKRYALELISDMGKWQSLPWLIRAATLPDETVAELARQLTEAWFSPPSCNRVFTKPTVAQRKAIDEAVEELQGKPGDTFLQKMQGWLQAV
jgi:HEAT repeat protein